MLFLQQPYNNHLSLFRLRFNASNGMMVKEEIMLESPALANANYCYVTKMTGRDEYAVLIMKDLDRNPDEKTRFTVWNGNHQLVKQTDLAINGRNISSLKLLFMKGANNGLYCTFRLETQIDTGKHQQYLVTTFLPVGDVRVQLHFSEIPDEYQAVASSMSYNPATGKEHILTTATYRFRREREIYNDHGLWAVAYLESYDSSRLDLTQQKVLAHDKIQAYNSADAHTLLHHYYTPEKIHITPDGRLFVLYEEAFSGGVWETGMYHPRTYMGNIGISRIDETGKELNGIVVPKMQGLESYYLPENVMTRSADQQLFPNTPKHSFYHQFSSFDLVPAGNTAYVIFNDNKKNNDLYPSEPIHPVDNYDYGNAVCYALREDSVLRTGSLFGTTAADEFKSCMLGSAHYDESTGTYAVLMLHRQGKKLETKMAWIHFSP